MMKRDSLTSLKEKLPWTLSSKIVYLKHKKTKSLRKSIT